MKFKRKYNLNTILKEIEEISNKAYCNSAKFNIAISGGRSITNLLINFKKLNTHFSNWNLIIVDERDVPLTDNLSNTKQIKDILSKSNLSTINVISFYHDGTICSNHSEEAYSQIEKIDYTVLGIGDDGHIASLFPENLNNDKLLKTNTTVIKNSPKPPSSRITVTYKFLSKCKRVTLLIIGKEKKHLIKNNNTNLPFNYLCTLTDLNLMHE